MYEKEGFILLIMMGKDMLHSNSFVVCVFVSVCDQWAGTMDVAQCSLSVWRDAG